MANEKQLTYNEPWILQRADPFVTRDAEGRYYFTATVPSYDRIVLRRAEHLSGLPQAEEKTVWQKHERGPMGAHIWAPELHFLSGRWYLYFAAGDQEDIWKIRPYVLACQGPDPMADEWKELGMMKCAEEDEFSFRAFSLDATVFENKGVNYYVWAEKVGVGRMISNLYIARMKSANQLDTVQVLLTTPDYDWERKGYWVNEGPAVLKKNGKLFLTFSASDTSANYCVGMLTADENADLLDPQSWVKDRYPVLKTCPEKKVFGPGHNSFTTDEKGNDILVYHARSAAELSGDPLSDPDRHARLMKINWEDNGRPLFQF